MAGPRGISWKSMIGNRHKSWKRPRRQVQPILKDSIGAEKSSIVCPGNTHGDWTKEESEYRRLRS